MSGAPAADGTQQRALQAHLQALRESLQGRSHLRDEATLTLRLELAAALLQLDDADAAWQAGRTLLDAAVDAGEFDIAARAAELLFLCDRPASLTALGHGIWLAVSYPVDAELSLGLLRHVVDETGDDSDGAAVAAATAHYLADLRASGARREDLRFLSAGLLAEVARRHAGVEGEEQFRFWVERLELDDPAVFLARLRTVVDVLVAGDWWFDTAALQARMPLH